jgi:hypothetical protein
MFQVIRAFVQRYNVYFTWLFYFIVAGLFVYSLQQKNKYSVESTPSTYSVGILDLYKIDTAEYKTYHTLLGQEKGKKALAQKALNWNIGYMLLLPIFFYVLYVIYNRKIKRIRKETQPLLDDAVSPKVLSLKQMVLANLKYKHIVLLLFILIMHTIEHIQLQTFLNSDGHSINLSSMRFVSGSIYVLYALLILTNMRLINVGYSFLKHLFYYNTPILLFLFFLYFMVSFNQGQNILLILTENDIYTGLFFIIINITAFWQWQLSKILQKSFRHKGNPIHLYSRDASIDLSDFSEEENNHYANAHFRKSIPRLLAVTVYLIPFYGFHKILHDSKVAYWAAEVSPSILFFVPFILLFVFLNSETISSRINRSPRNWSASWYTILLLLLVSMFVLMFLANNEPTIKGLDLRAWSLFLQMLFFIVLVMGRKYNAWLHLGAINFKLFVAVMLTCLFGLLSLFWLHLYQASFVFSTFSKYNILNFTIALLLFWELVIVVLLQYGEFKKISFITIAVVALWVMMILGKDSNYQLPNRKQSFHYTQLPTDSAYISQWLDVHSQHLLNTDRAIYIINGYGGGIRASAFFYYTISMLNQSFQARYGFDSSVHFMNNILSFSTASGSSLGSVKLVSDFVYNRGQLMDTSTMQVFYKQDFLSSVLVSHVGTELPMKLFSAKRLRDRLQEQNWTILDSNLGKFYYATYQQHGASLPLLFFNATEGRSGKSSLLAPVQLSDRYYAGKLSISQQIPNNEMSLADAALITARFPLLSPGLSTPNHEIFFDGGLSENSGCAAHTMLLRQVEDILVNKYGASHPFKIKVLSIHNTPKGDTVNKLMPVSQPAALINTFFQVGVSGYSQLAEKQLREACRLKGHLFYDYYVDDQSSVILPLGWLLSDSASYRLYNNAKSVQRPF